MSQNYINVATFHLLLGKWQTVARDCGFGFIILYHYIIEDNFESPLQLVKL